MNDPDLEKPALSKSFKTTSHSFYRRFPGIDGLVFVTAVLETNVNWFESTVTWTEKRGVTSCCSSLSSSPGEISWALPGHAVISFDNILNGCCWFFFSGAERRGGWWRKRRRRRRRRGWCNRAEITVLTSQSVRVSEDETSDRLRRWRRCQKHQKRKQTLSLSHTHTHTHTHTYLLCRVLNLLIFEVLQDYLSHTAAVTSLYIWGFS